MAAPASSTMSEITIGVRHSRQRQAGAPSGPAVATRPCGVAGVAGGAGGVGAVGVVGVVVLMASAQPRRRGP